MMHIACCWRSGEIDCIPETALIPPGVIPLARGPRQALEQIISVRARHSYHAEGYLVPGVPEADDAAAALAALQTWVLWAFSGFPIVSGMREVSYDQ